MPPFSQEKQITIAETNNVSESGENKLDQNDALNSEESKIQTGSLLTTECKTEESEADVELNGKKLEEVVEETCIVVKSDDLNLQTSSKDLDLKNEVNENQLKTEIMQQKDVGEMETSRTEESNTANETNPSDQSSVKIGIESNNESSSHPTAVDIIPVPTPSDRGMPSPGRIELQKLGNSGN